MKLLNHFILIITIVCSILGSAYGFGKKSDICGSWNNYCNGGTAVDTYYITPSGPTPEQIKKQKEAMEAKDLQDASWDAYDTGMEYVKQKQWGNAVIHFQEALEYNPDNQDAINDLQKAKQKLQEAFLQSKALNEAAAAAKHGQMLDYQESKKVFDTTGIKTQIVSPVMTVDGRAYKESLRRPFEVPVSLKNNPQIMKFQKERKTLEKEFEKLEKELQTVKEKKESDEKNKAKLEVEEVKVKDKMDAVKQKVQVIDVKMETFVINLKKNTTPKK